MKELDWRRRMNREEESMNNCRAAAAALFLLLLACAASAAGWEYRRNENLMTGEVTDTFAHLSGQGVIVVANRKEGGIDAHVRVAGYVDCPKFCRILVRADETAPREFDATGVASELQIRDPAAFVDYIRNAKRVRVQSRFANVPGNEVKGEVVSTFYSDAPLVIHPLRKAVGQ